MTFLSYPFPLVFTEKLEDVIRLPDLVTLAAMKAFALGRRAKWKDYVDLYVILKSKTLTEITARAASLFGNEFNEKLFREQLSYFEDIDYSETIDYMKGFEVSNDEVKKNSSKGSYSALISFLYITISPLLITRRVDEVHTRSLHLKKDHARLLDNFRI